MGGAERVGQRAEPAVELDGAIEGDTEAVLPQTDASERGYATQSSKP